MSKYQLKAAKIMLYVEAMQYGEKYRNGNEKRK